MKKGFTLIELLAVIVIIAVIGLIVTPIVLTNIEKSRVSSYRTSVQNVMEAAKEYVSKNYVDNDFPDDGINIVKTDLRLKNNDFQSGVIIRNRDKEIEVVNVYDGEYCAKGTKNNLVVEKVSSKDDCNNIDASAPKIRKIVVNSVTNNTVTIMTILEPGEDNIKEYEYCIGDNCEITTSKNHRFVGLKTDTEYEITVKVRNNNYRTSEQYTDVITESQKTIKVKTDSIEAPKIKVSSISYAGSKKITITYSKTENSHINKYIIYDEKNNKILEQTIEENELSFDAVQNGKVVAETIVDNEKYTSELSIIGIDTAGPTYDVIYHKNDAGWSRSKTVEIINVKDDTLLPKNMYSFDGGKTWTSSPIRTYNKNQVLTIVVRDKLGNKTKKTFNVNKVDRTAPTCTLKVVSGIAGNNGWYRSNVTIDFNSITENQSGISTKSIINQIITNEGYTKAVGTVLDNVGNKGTCEYTAMIDKTPPSCTSAGGSTDWTNSSRTLIGYCGDSLSSCRANVSWLINWRGNWTNLSPGTVYDNAGNATYCPSNQTVRIGEYSQSSACGYNSCLYQSNDCYGGYQNGACTQWPYCASRSCGTYSCNKHTCYSGWSNWYITAQCYNYGSIQASLQKCNSKLPSNTSTVQYQCQTRAKGSNVCRYKKDRTAYTCYDTCNYSCRSSSCGACEAYEQVWNSCIGRQMTCHGGYNTCWHT